MSKLYTRVLASHKYIQNQVPARASNKTWPFIVLLSTLFRTGIPDDICRRVPRQSHHHCCFQVFLALLLWCISILPGGMLKGSELSFTSHIFFTYLAAHFFQIFVCQFHLQGVNVGIQILDFGCPWEIVGNICQWLNTGLSEHIAIKHDYWWLALNLEGNNKCRKTQE